MQVPTGLFIDGQFTPAPGGKTFPVTNPATGEHLQDVADGSAEDAKRAIEAAHRAFPGWAGLTADQRAQALDAVYRLIKQEADRLAALLTSEQGKPLAEARAEVQIGAEYVRWYAEEARRVYGEMIPASSPTNRIWVMRQPLGVVAAITPWNFPSSMITRKVAPALAAGCTIVLKPAEQTPLSALALAELFQQAGLPPGVINVVTTSDPAPVGEEFLTNPLVRKISFTGSTAVGKWLAERAAKQMKRVGLELGGHAPFIVFDDADLDAAVKGAIGSKFRNAGQTCVCANRIYVQESVAEEFSRRMAEAVKALKVGPGSDPSSQLGPLIDADACAKVEAQVADATAKGATVLAGGQRLTGPGYDGGYFYAPTLLANVTDEMLIVHEETFGPVAPIMTFRTEQEAIRLANDTPYGLAAYVFSRDLGRVVRVSEGLEYGMVGVNEVGIALPQAPFGGIKESGVGREGGHHGLDGFLEYKYVHVGLGQPPAGA